MLISNMKNETSKNLFMINKKIKEDIDNKLRKSSVIYNELANQDNQFSKQTLKFLVKEERRMIENEFIDSFYKSNTDSDLDDDTKYLMKYVKELEDLIVYITKDIRSVQEKEISRITKEFLTNFYERKYNIDIASVLSVIVGSSKLEIEMKKVLYQQNNYYESLKLCRNYDLFYTKYKKYYQNLLEY